MSLGQTGFSNGGVSGLRCFDGGRWTETQAPMQRGQPPPPSAQQPIIVRPEALREPTLSANEKHKSPTIRP